MHNRPLHFEITVFADKKSQYSNAVRLEPFNSFSKCFKLIQFSLATHLDKRMYPMTKFLGVPTMVAVLFNSFVWLPRVDNVKDIGLIEFHS